jgi:hypothetical protein
MYDKPKVDIPPRGLLIGVIAGAIAWAVIIGLAYLLVTSLKRVAEHVSEPRTIATAGMAK